MIAHINHTIPNIIRLNSICNIHEFSIHDTITESRKEAHDFWEFLYLKTGRLNVLVDGELYTLSAGDLILYPPYAFHSVAMSQGAVAMCVTFSTDSARLHQLTGRILLLTPEAQQSLLNINNLKCMLFADVKGSSLVKDFTLRGMNQTQAFDSADFQKLTNLLEIFLVDLCKAEQRSQNDHLQSQEFAALNAYLKKNLNRSLSLEEISAEYGVAIPQLQKSCREQCGCGPITYFISLKIGAAKQMIKEGTFTFTEISEALGFSSVHYFSRLFKSKTGMSPSEYEATLRKGR